MQSERKEKQEKALVWLLLVLAFTKCALLVSRVVNKPNTQLTSNVNDFVNATLRTMHAKEKPLLAG